MNDPSATPVDVQEQRNWLLDHKAQLNLSWSEIAKRLGIPTGTVSQFGSGNYQGDNTKIAETVYRYRQLLATQSAIDIDAPEKPRYFKTETSCQLENMLAWAQRGKIVVAAMGAGTGKSTVAEQFQAAYPNVFVATMAPSTAGVNTMQIAVLEALGETNAKGTPQKLSMRIRAILGNLRSPLLILDETQHLSEKALDEIRGWNDASGVGIALFGNAGLLQRLEGGNRRDAFAQLFSRVSLKVVRQLPLMGDIDALAHAWGIFDDKIIGLLRKICMTPGALRNGTMALELGTMLAASEKQILQSEHLQDAWAQLSSRSVLS